MVALKFDEVSPFRHAVIVTDSLRYVRTDEPFPLKWTRLTPFNEKRKMEIILNKYP